MSFPRYETYKDSGVEWLGEVPAHWKIQSLKSMVSMKSGEQITSNDIDEIGKYPVFGGNGLRGYTDKFTHEGEFVLIGRQGALCGNINYGRGKFWASEHAVVVSQKSEIVIFWLGELLRIANLGQYSITAAQPGLSVEAIGNIRIPCPPISEQQTLAAFLDHETEKIDALITEQQRLIELLKEKRQAVISHAVTKGLNPNAPMKDSGIEWLGEIPAHWEVKKVSRYFVARKGANAAMLTKEYCGGIEGGYPVYSGQTENNGIMSSINCYEFDAGDQGYLFSTTVGAKAMSLSHISGKFNLSQNCMVIIPRMKEIVVRFFFYHLQPAFLFARGLIPEHMQASFRMEDLYQYRFALPSIEEQINIANFLDHEITKFNALTTETQHNIDLLQERRSALISAAVTGKIDVRGLVALEPDRALVSV